MKNALVVIIAAAGCIPVAALSPDAAPSAQEPAVSVSHNIGVVSDYRYRGVSLTNRKAAVQGGVDVALRSGWFVGTWASNVADTGGSNVELDLYGGYASSAGGFDYSISGYEYVYPGGHGVSYFEFTGQVGRTFGPVTVAAIAAYYPDQAHTDTDNIYLAGDATIELPVSGLSLHGRAGYEDGGYDGKIDWDLGLLYTTGPLTLSAGYVGTDQGGRNELGRNGRGALVAGAKLSF